ncbi:MAG TPA: 4Fe-4S dicluster domain-containing protein [Prolixibacteraceae bacterium]|nr:4Fe-4S dicluster domain-containing protein [Prolixibacteraceae bacterium]HPS11752.1 4Fe-4S dicluster domain-containing protein [Prolixibacteraceae bacterium]
MNTEDLIYNVKQQTGVNIRECYQCGKCTAGCPVAEKMDLRPSVIMRMIQSGNNEEMDQILRSYTIWLCLTCETCYSRCPMEIDIPKVMDYLRQRSLAEGKVNPEARKIVAFHKSFLNTVKRNGRLSELFLTIDYKMRSLGSGTLFQDMTVAPGMISRGKLHLIPEQIKDKKGFSRLFKNQLNQRKP